MKNVAATEVSEQNNSKLSEMIWKLFNFYVVKFSTSEIVKSLLC